MESKDKMIGAILIIVGLFFIGLGVFVNMNTSKVKTTNTVYQEQVIDNTKITPETNIEDETNGVEVYTETDTQNTINESTQYIY